MPLAAVGIHITAEGRAWAWARAELRALWPCRFSESPVWVAKSLQWTDTTTHEGTEASMGRLVKHVKTELRDWGAWWADDTGFVTRRFKALVDFALVLPVVFAMMFLSALVGVPEDFLVSAGLLLTGGALILSRRWWWSRLQAVAWALVCLGVLVADWAIADLVPGGAYERVIRPIIIGVAVVIGAYVVYRKWGAQLRRFFRGRDVDANVTPRPPLTRPRAELRRRV